MTTQHKKDLYARFTGHNVEIDIHACLSSMANLCALLECDNVASEIIKDEADEITTACNKLLDSVQS